MTVLSWTSVAVAAGLTIPPLVALYFLKLKRTVREVPSTLLWKRAVEDLHVNSPFQRLRASLLLLLQLLFLLATAFALGKPMFQTAQTHKSTIILLVDQSASMGVYEADERTRLEQAKEQAKAYIENLDDGARAMVIAFCDRATVVSAFDTDKRALKEKIDLIEQTQSTSNLAEAMSLAEAYTQNMVIGREDEGDIELSGGAPPASIALFTDGRIEDADRVALKKFDVDKISVVRVGQREDNVGILAMDARRNYERPEFLEVAATVRNFGPAPVSVDATLYVDNTNVDIQTITLGASPRDNDEAGAPPAERRAEATNIVVFDAIEFEGGGLIEIVLKTDDALSADNRAFTIIDEPSHVRVLLVTNGNMFLENALAALPFETETMTPAEYEAADDEVLLDGERSAFDVVVLDDHSTARLPQGNYFFWGSAPMIEGVTVGATVADEVIFNWDDTHPILRYVGVETLYVYEWFALTLPPEAISLIEGERTPVLSYVTRDASQYLISAFRLISEDGQGGLAYNTYWATTVDFLIFMQNSVNYLASNIATASRQSVVPGEPVTLPVPDDVESIKIIRPDKREDTVPTAGYQSVHYADTRTVGPYTLDPGVPGQDTFAVNLFNRIESDVAPASSVTLGAETVAAQATTVNVNEPAWQYFLLGVLALLLIEWVIYNYRIFV